MADSEIKELSDLNTELKVTKEISEIADSNSNSVRTKEASETNIEAKLEDLS